MNHEKIFRLAELCNIQANYTDAWGNHQTVTDDNVCKILSAMGFDLTSEQAITDAIVQIEQVEWKQWLKPVVVSAIGFQESPYFIIAVNKQDNQQVFEWQMSEENGTTHTGAFVPAQTEWVEEKQFLEGCFQKYKVTLPIQSDIGYHHLTLCLRSAAPESSVSTKFIVVPRECYQPECVRDNGRVWGASVQLYTLRSEKNWGIGDFGDLAKLATAAGERGVDILGLNPLHAMFPHNAHAYSPYSPSNRQFINILYIDIESVPEYQSGAEIQAFIASNELKLELEAVRKEALVDYPRVAHLKRQALEKLFVEFQRSHLNQQTDRGNQFAHYIEQGGESLYAHALYEALQEYFYNQDWSFWGWPVWPEEYRDQSSPAVAEFAAQYADRVYFFLYLQWLSSTQLDYAQSCATSAGMKIGLYRDLAVGIDRAGSESWCNRSLYTNDANVGAPPDALCTTGQDWGLPATVPTVLEQTGYDAFIKLIQANMQGCGALRIDHILGMYRLWWVPMPGSATDGAYVYYDLQALFGILALESHRNQCMVVGEDLGTVPGEIQQAMQSMAVYGYRVFFFERNADGSFIEPNEFASYTAATVSTHDIPTLVGYWEARDIDTRRELNLLPNEAVCQQQYAERDQDRQRILAQLDAYDIDYGTLEYHDGKPVMTDKLREAIQVYVAKTASKLMLVQLEDVLGQPLQVNLPGTEREYPNWQRKLIANVEDIFSSPAAIALANELNKVRP